MLVGWAGSREINLCDPDVLAREQFKVIVEKLGD
jgi:hypothetical protein